MGYLPAYLPATIKYIPATTKYLPAISNFTKMLTKIHKFVNKKGVQPISIRFRLYALLFILIQKVCS